MKLSELFCSFSFADQRDAGGLGGCIDHGTWISMGMLCQGNLTEMSPLRSDRATTSAQTDAWCSVPPFCRIP